MNLSPLSVALLFLSFFITFSSCSNDEADFTGGDVSINCGSTGISAASNGHQWLGDFSSKLSPLLQLGGLSTALTAIDKLTSADPVPHKTARISRSTFSYAFQLNAGQKIIRLHFNPTPYRGFKGLRDFFTVEAGPFTLVANFSASLTARALAVNTFAKEFCFNIQQNQHLTITFSPETSQSLDTYAFINGIEIISIPPSRSYFDGAEIGLRLVGQNSIVSVDDSTALEIVHRLRIKPDIVQPTGHFDGIFPKRTTQRADADKVRNSTWKMPVDAGFRYLIRLHLSEVGLKIAGVGGSMFQILINEMIALTNTEMMNGWDHDILHKDYMVEMRGHKEYGGRDILISFQSFEELADGVGVLAGFEIVKLSNPDDSLASPNPRPQPLDLQSHTIRKLFLVLGCKHATATVTVVVISVLSIILHKLREIWEAWSTEDEHKPSVKAERRCRLFSLAEIHSATKNFNSGLVIGRGGFGKVYKGLIDNGKKFVAVKRLKWNSKQGAREFLTEIETLSELRHINLVSLIGYCSEHNEMILVYEYMACGTLADHLYKLGSDCSSLSWKQRLKICVGAARGLDYLHTGNGIIHRDVKASNILLDENFIAKVSDFGLAKTEDKSKLQSHVSTLVKGTRGYFDPYYIRTGKLTRKSDIYAFGVVLLEALCGRSALDVYLLEEERLLSSWAIDMIHKGEVYQIVASNLSEEISPGSLKTFVEIAERCLFDEPKYRPTMSQIVLQLESALDQHDSNEQNDIGSVINDVYLADEDIILSENTDVQTVTSPERHSPADEGDSKKQKAYGLLRFWPLGAFWNRRKPSKRYELTSLKSEISGSCVNLRRFDLTTITTATNQFSPSQKIAADAWWSMYKAVLPTGQTVSVKRYSLNLSYSLEGFKNEIFLGSSFNHRNIMNPLGYCIHEKGEAIIVHDYMEPLFDHLHKSGNSPLTWKQRLQICIDAAKGLEYLHTGADNFIIHRDVKASSILLDKKRMVKVSNFCLSKAWPSGKGDTNLSTKLVGTFGYLDPEYFQNSQLTKKCDVYSYGVVLFEVLCGRQVVIHNSEVEQEEAHLASWATLCFKEGRLENIIDSNLDGQIAPECLRIFSETAIACLNGQGSNRPAMRDVVQNLGLAMKLQLIS